MGAQMYLKVYDPTSKGFYYVNKKTKEVSWTKPMLMGKEELEPTPSSRVAAEADGLDLPPRVLRTPRVLAKDLTPDQAACMLQGMWRARKARHMLHKAVAQMYSKVYDADSKDFYYINKKSGEVSWTKPLL